MWYEIDTRINLVQIIRDYIYTFESSIIGHNIISTCSITVFIELLEFLQLLNMLYKSIIH